MCVCVYMYKYICVYISIGFRVITRTREPVHGLTRSHKNMNTVFRLVNPVFDKNMYMLKVTVFRKRATYE